MLAPLGVPVAGKETAHGGLRGPPVSHDHHWLSGLTLRAWLARVLRSGSKESSAEWLDRPPCAMSNTLWAVGLLPRLLEESQGLADSGE